MPIDEFPFLGAMDLDSPNTKIPRGFHRTARNGYFRGVPNNHHFESAMGTTARPNPFLPNTGVNKNLKLFYDPINYRIISFNYNSGGLHGIYAYYTLTKTWFSLIQIGAGTDGDILGFTASGLITSVNILYNEQVDGNLLFFIDSMGRTTCFNIERYQNTPYTLIKRSFIELIKAPPQMPIKAVYENDTTVSTNNLKNALYQFKYRFVYDDFQTSVYSSGSRVPLPVYPFLQSVDADKTQNSRIALYMSTGDVDAKKIEVYATQVTDAATASASSNDSSLGNYFLVSTLDKSQLSIPDNDIWRFEFYNDGTYVFGDLKEETLLFDYVPLYANCLDLLNGNVPAIGGVTEGYDLVNVNLNFASFLNYDAPYDIQNGLLFFAAQTGIDSNGNAGDQIKIFLTGAGTNDGSGNPVSFSNNVRRNYQYFVDAKDNTGTDFSFNYTNSSSLITINSIFAGISAAAVAAGFTVVSQTTNELIISKTNIILYGSRILNVNPSTPVNVNDVAFAFPHQSAYEFAIQYFDRYGRTNGAMPSVIGGINTMQDVSTTTLPLIAFYINNPPPSWAWYYQLLRSPNLTYNKLVNWISNQTFVSVDLTDNVNYAYIGISNFDEYNQDIKASTPVVSYEFQAGDRIRFLQRVTSPTTTTNLLPYDYEIVSTVVDPVGNGVTNTGTFIKIIYPTADINGNFNFGGSQFQNYKIELYNYVRRASDATSQVYYEFGRQYNIGNPGTNTAFHYGAEQHQTPNYSQPAQINFNDGDFFYKYRNVPYGGIYYYTCGGGANFNDLWNQIPMNIANAPVILPSYTMNSELGEPFFNPVSVGLGFMHNTATFQLPVRLTGEFLCQCGANNTTSFTLACYNAPTKPFNLNPTTQAIIQNIIQTFDIGLGENIQQYTVPFDGKVITNPNDYLWFIISDDNAANHVGIRVSSFTCKVEVLQLFTIPVIESSFSDRFNIVTSSNSRPSVYDSNAKQNYYKERYRWGLADITSTNINNTNRFYPQDYDDADLTHGAIVIMRSRQKELRIFQERRCGRTGVYNKFLNQSTGQNVLTTTDVIITQNNIQYYEGEFGIANQPASLISSGYADYFVDPVRGCILRLSLDGLINISLLYRIQTWAGSTLPNYLSDYTYQFGGNAAVLGAFNFTEDRDSEAIFVVQGGTNAALQTIQGESIAFVEAGNKWSSYYDFVPDSIVCAENVLFTAYNGILYSHDNTTTYCNFYGTQYVPSITLVKNDNINIRKSWQSIEEVSNVIWNCPAITTELISYGTTPQQSNLVDEDFLYLEGKWAASFYRDINSIGGLINGWGLKGTYMILQLQPTDGSQFAYLATVPVKYIISHQLVK